MRRRCKRSVILKKELVNASGHSKRRDDRMGRELTEAAYKTSPRSMRVLPRPVRRRGQPAAARPHGPQAPAGLHRAQTRCATPATAAPCGRVEQRERTRDIWPSTSTGRPRRSVRRVRFRLRWRSLGRRGRGRRRGLGPEEPCERKETGEAPGLLWRGWGHARARLVRVVIVTVVVFIVDSGYV